MTNLQTHYHLKLNFQKVDQPTGSKWLIHGIKRRKDNHDIKESEGNIFNPIFKENA